MIASYFQLANVTLFIILMLCIILGVFYILYIKQNVRYRYSLGRLIQKKYEHEAIFYQYFFLVIRSLLLGSLAFLSSRLQKVDLNSMASVDGIDIIMTLDVSGSMSIHDFQDDNRTRIEVAKSEAIRFIKKRDYDSIGLVIFAKEAITRCPMTIDKFLLSDIIADTQIGIINFEGTMIAKAILTSLNRLKSSQAKSRILILLTDGAPGPGDLDMYIAIEAAQKLGVKIYTIGIGNEEGGIVMHPLYGPISLPSVNKELLKYIADETGGNYFLATNRKDMRCIYDTIDSLEKTSHEVPYYHKYYEIILPFGIAVLILSFLELILSTFIWFML